jgi:hypothetical protein
MLSALLLFAAVAAAPGDLIRCVGADGVVRWQDRPCARGEQSDRVEGGTATPDTTSLRRRIEALRGTAPPPLPRAARAPGYRGTPTAVPEAQLAVCSERFLACAHHDGARMDACIAGIPACARGGGPCCPTACTAAYARERRAGTTPPDAVYLALVAPDGGGCGLPAR